MSEPELHQALAWGVIVTAAITFVALLFIEAPYGRHRRPGWGPEMPARWAWVVMESPAVLGFTAIYLLGSRRAELAPLVLLALWQLHYINRTFVFPFKLKTEGKTTPVAVVAIAIGFNLVNAYLNARWISHLGRYPTSWLHDPRLIAGAALFLVGRRINIRADEALIALRSRSEGYAIPRGGLFRWVSCPNYLGEIIEWLGWAIATWSLAGWSFAVFTFANLAPRAVAHHRWYRERFPDYPPERRAVVPGLW